MSPRWWSTGQPGPNQTTTVQRRTPRRARVHRETWLILLAIVVVSVWLVGLIGQWHS